MRVVVDPLLCESNGICSGIVSEVFELGDDDVLRVLVEYPDESLTARIAAAARNCPKQAITLLESDEPEGSSR